MSVPSPGLDPPFPCMQVRTVVIVMASSVYINSVGLCGYVNKFVDRSEEEGGFWYADQWQHPRVVTLAAEVAGRGWNCFSFCEVEAGSGRRQPSVEFFFPPLWIHSSLEAGSMTGDLLLLVQERSRIYMVTQNIDCYFYELLWHIGICFDVLLTVQHNIFILVINQLDAHSFCFTVSLFHASTCFEHHVLIIRRSNLYYTASGIITLARTRGGHLQSVMIPEAV